MQGHSTILVPVRALDEERAAKALFAAAGPGPGLRLQVALLRHVLGAAAAIPGVEVRLCVGHDCGELVAAARATVGGGQLTIIEQVGADRSERLRNAFAQAFSTGAGRVVAVAADLPTLGSGHLREALAAIESAEPRAVAGFAEDGGVWLAGMNAFERAPFEQIPWGTALAGAALARGLRENGFALTALATLRDLDDRDDLQAHVRKLRHDKSNPVLAAMLEVAHETRTLRDGGAAAGKLVTIDEPTGTHKRARNLAI